MIRSILAALVAAAIAVMPNVPALGIGDPPTPPQNVVATAGNASAVVTWEASKDPNGIPIHHYTATAEPGAASCETPDGDTTTCTVTGLLNATTYTFTVTATNDEKRTSDPSEPSNAVTPYTVPDPPTLAFVWARDRALNVRWWVSGNGGSPLLDYTAIAEPGGQQCTVDAALTSCDIGGLTNGETYSVTVRARNIAGFSAASNAMSGSPFGAPGVVTDIHLVAGDHSVAVSWVAPADDGGRPLAYYLVQTDGRDCRSDSTSCTVTGLVGGRAYAFRVLAVNSGGGSSTSPASPPTTPGGGSGTPDGGPTLAGWGDNSKGALGDGSLDSASIPRPAYLGTGLDGKDILKATAGTEHSCALDTSGGVYCWGTGFFTDSSTRSTTAIPQSGLPGPATDVAAGYEFTCAIVDGRAYCWGRGSRGQLGTGGWSDSRVPVAVATGGVLSGKHLVAITTGLWHACALDDAGRAYCWGHGLSGELGDGLHSDSPSPVAVDTEGALAAADLVAIDTGDHFTCAADAAGNAYCWGSGASGQLGNGTFADAFVPVPVGKVAGRSVSAGAAHVCAVATDGSVRCWGNNMAGQLGDGTTDPKGVPTVVSGVSAVTVAAGGMTSCAVRGDGSAACWGEGRGGNLGNGVNAISTVPVEVSLGGRLLVSVVGGQSHVLALAAAAPDAPTHVVAAAGDGLVSLSWREPADHGAPIDVYRVTAEPGGASCTSTVQSCVVTGLTNGTAYRFWVVGHNLAGWGPAGWTDAVTPTAALTAPAKVRGLRAKVLPRKVRITWKSASGATGYSYRIRRPHKNFSAWHSVTLRHVVLRHPKVGKYRVQVRAVNTAGHSPAVSAVFRVRR